jgi:hypothetical protein
MADKMLSCDTEGHIETVNVQKPKRTISVLGDIATKK